MITIRNDFHGTEVRLRADIGGTLTTAQVRRAKARLCGIENCTCSGDAGERGEQDGFELVPTQDGLYIASTKRRAGSPGVVPGEIQRRRNVTLSDRLAEKARSLGGGNLSKGVRLALEGGNRQKKETEQ